MENINLKKIVDIPVLENLDENTHLLAEHDGEYARVPKDAVGGSGVLNVGVVLKDGVAASNCTYADIDAAITASKPVFAVINSWMSDHWNTGCAQRITAVSDASLGNYYQVYFVAGDNDSYLNIRFYESGTVEMEADE